MPYIGRDLNRGNYLKLDDISSSFNGNTQTFNLTVGGSAFTPGSAFSILVSVGGVIQEPESAYQVENSEITFANAPTAQDSFFCIALGVALGIGVPGNGTVNGAHLAKPFNYDGYFYLDDTNNRVGIGSLAPTSTLDVRGDAKISGILTATSYSGPISNPSGISTFYDLRVSNNLIVEGTTTTLDTNVTGVDRIEINANSNTDTAIVGIQSGTADIVNLYDGTTEVLTVKDGGTVTVTGSNINIEGGSAANSQFKVNSTGRYRGIQLDENGTRKAHFQHDATDNKLVVGTAEGTMQFNSGDTPRIILNSSGHWVPFADSTYDLGISATRWRNLYVDAATITGTADINGDIDVDGQTHLDDVSISGITTMGGDLIIENTYPRIYLRDTNHNPDFSIINNDGNLGFRDDTNGKYRLTIYSNGKVGVNSTAPSQQFTSYAESGYPILANGPSNAIGLGVNGAIVFGTKDLGSYGSGILDASYLEFKINGSPKLTIMPGGGAIGIHTTTGTNTVSIGGAAGLGVKFHNFTSGNSTYVTVQSGDMFATNIGGTGYATWHTQGNEKMRLANNGRLGIGTTNPQTLLHLSSSNPIIRLTDTDNNAYSAIGGESGFLYLYTNSTARDFIFRGTGEVARLTGDGKLGIGSATPGRPLTITAADARIRLQDSDTGGHAEIYTDNSHSLHFGADSSSSSGSSNMLFEFNGTEAVRIRESGGDILYGAGDHIVGASAGLVNGLGSHNNANVGSVLYGVNDGGGFNGMKVENFDDGTYNSQRIKFLTGKGGVSMATVRMGINENGQVSIGSTTTTEAGSNTKLVVLGSGTPGVHPSSIAASTVATFRMTGGLSHAVGVSILGGNTGSSALNLGDRDNELIGRIIYSHTSGNATDYMAFYAQGAERVRISADGGTAISKGGNPHADSGWAGLEVRSAQNTHQLVLSSTDNAANSNQVRLGFKLHPSYQNERTKAAIICQGSGGGYGEVSRMMFCIDSAADNGSADAHSIDEKLRITSSGELIIYPTASSNQNTSIRFANTASTPFMTFKSNNVSDAAEIRVPENTAGGHMQLKTKRRTGADNAGSLLTVLDLDPYGSVYTGNISGTAKTYPVIGGDTIGTGGEIGQVNYNDIRSPQGSIGGWVELGIDYNGAHPWPPRAYKIAQHENGRNCTRVYHIWHDGDANFHYGGMWEVRINEWGSTADKFESVHFRCINGRRTDLSLLVYDNTDGIWIRPHTIWGKLHIRRAGWDNSGRAIGSSYCAVTNSGALAFGDTLGVNGSIPSGYFELYPFDGAGGSHTGGRYIEQNTNSDG